MLLGNRIEFGKKNLRETKWMKRMDFTLCDHCRRGQKRREKDLGGAATAPNTRQVFFSKKQTPP